MHFNFFQIFSFVSGLASLFLGTFVLTRNRSSELHRSFFMLSLGIFVLQAGTAVRWMLTDVHDSLFVGKLVYVGVTLIPPTYFHFTSEFYRLYQRRLVPCMYALSTILLLFLLQDNFFVGIRTTFWGSQLLGGPPQRVYLALWFIPLLSGFVNSYRGFRNAESAFERQRRRFLFITHAVTCLAAIEFLPALGIFPPFPVSFLFFLIFVGATAYAILHYRLMEIHVLIKRASVITFMAITAAVFLYIASLYLQPHLITMYGQYWVFFPVSISFVIGLSIFRLVMVIREMEEQDLARRHTYRPLLSRAAERFVRVLTIDELLSFTTRDVSAWVRLDYVGIMVWVPATKEFVLRRSLNRSRRYPPVRRGISIAADDPLIMEAIRRRQPLVRAEIAHYIETDKKITPQEVAFLGKVVAAMQRLGAEIVIPCFCEETLLLLINLGRQLDPGQPLTREDLGLFGSLSGQVGRTMHGLLLKQETIQLVVASQNVLISAIEAKDSYTKGHTDRVAQVASVLGAQLEKLVRHYPNGLETLRWAAQLHDVGKIGIPDAVLLKPGPLDEREWKIIREHPVNGVNIVGPVREWLGEDVCSGILHHHENYDGSGYPSHQKGDDIHLFARIIRVADAFDAMGTSRPYREAMTREEIIAELQKCRGTQFDPLVVDTMLELCNTGKI